MAAKTVQFARGNGSFKQEFPRIWEYRILKAKDISLGGNDRLLKATRESDCMIVDSAEHVFIARYGGRKELSHWSKHELPLAQLIGKLDTDHWTKLKRRHQLFMDPGSKMKHTKSANDLPKPHDGIQRHYYDQSRNREYLLQEGRTMYSLPDVDRTGNCRNKTTRKQPSIFNQHAKNGFKFWMEGEPSVNKISLCSKYTFGSKYTVHGLGNAPRN